MTDQFGINIPNSYGDTRRESKSIPKKETIKKIPNNTNKVRVKIIRGVLKGDDSTSNQQ